jgi:hypothetical protein
VIEAAVRGHGVASTLDLARRICSRTARAGLATSVPTAYSYYFVTRPQALSNHRIGNVS